MLVFDDERPNLTNKAQRQGPDGGGEHGQKALVDELMRSSQASLAESKRQNHENAIMTAKTIKKARDLKLIMKELGVGQKGNGDDALEAIADFNKDMRVLALGVCQIQDQLKYVLEENDLLVSWLEALEQDTLAAEDRIIKLQRSNPIGK